MKWLIATIIVAAAVHYWDVRTYVPVYLCEEVSGPV